MKFREAEKTIHTIKKPPVFLSTCGSQSVTECFQRGMQAVLFEAGKDAFFDSTFFTDFVMDGKKSVWTEKAEIMNGHDNGDSASFCFRENAGIDQRIKIVNMNDIRLFPIQKACEMLLADRIPDTGKKSFCRTDQTMQFLGGSTEGNYFTSVGREQIDMIPDDRFFPGKLPIVIMNDGYFHDFYAE